MKNMKYVIMLIIVIVLVILAYYEYMVPVNAVINGKGSVYYANRYEAQTNINAYVKALKTDIPKAKIDVKVKYETANDKKGTDDLAKLIKAQIPSVVISIDGIPYVGFPTRENAEEFINVYLDKNKLPGGVKPEIEGKVTIDDSLIDSYQYFSITEDALKFFTEGIGKGAIKVVAPKSNKK